MVTYFSPGRKPFALWCFDFCIASQVALALLDDPLFMIHHCNIDRIWALYQDYHDQDLAPSNTLSENCYSEGRGIGLDDPLPFTSGTGPHSSFFLRENGRLPTPRDVHHSFGEVLKVTYANDYLGLLLSTTDSSYLGSNNHSWIQLASGPVNGINCDRRLLEDRASTNITISDASNLLGIPRDVPPWSNLTKRMMWDNYTSEGFSPSDTLNAITYQECQNQGNQLLASQSWIEMHGMQNYSDLFRCFNSGDPNSCNPKISIKSMATRSQFEFQYDPIQVIRFGDESVTFSLSQVWRYDSIDRVALHYMNVQGQLECRTYDKVFAGEFGVFEAQCVDGQASPILYASDSLFVTSVPNNVISKTCRSAGISSKKTYAHKVTLPCRLDALQCPPPVVSKPVCDGSINFAIANETFEAPKDSESWVFSSMGKRNKFGAYLLPKHGTSKTYQIPTAANSATIAMQIYELRCNKPTKVSLLIGSDQTVDLGELSCGIHKPKKFVSNSIEVEIHSEVDAIVKVVLVVPPQTYSETGRLTIGIRNSMIGIQSISIVADCSGSRPVWEESEVQNVIDHAVLP